MASRRLILIDAMAALYRSFFAIRGLETSTGLPSNAVFGFIRALKQLREWWAPTHWIVVFDGGAPEERLALLSDYKANRPPMPEGLAAQLEPVEEYLNCAEIAFVRRERQEADDLMASLAHRAAPEAEEILIASSDKDMFQLVGGKVRIVAMSGEKKAMGPDEVRAKTGVWPAEIVDWLALVGDSSDNIPGIPGIGPKTAAKLLVEHGSVDTIVSKADELGSARVAEAILRNRADLVRNRDLVRLRTDLDVPVHWPDLAVRAGNRSRLIAFFEKYEFNSMARELREPDLFGA